MSKEDKMIELLEELVRWTRVTSIPNVKRLLLELLQTPEEKVAYEYSDGKGSQDIARIVGISYSTITLWWKKWLKAGIAEAISAKGGQRAKRVFSLEDFGIEIPKLTSKGKEAKPTEGEPKIKENFEGQR